MGRGSDADLQITRLCTFAQLDEKPPWVTFPTVRL